MLSTFVHSFLAILSIKRRKKSFCDVYHKLFFLCKNELENISYLEPFFVAFDILKGPDQNGQKCQIYSKRTFLKSPRKLPSWAKDLRKLAIFARQDNYNTRVRNSNIKSTRVKDIKTENLLNWKVSLSHDTNHTYIINEVWMAGKKGVDKFEFTYLANFPVKILSLGLILLLSTGKSRAASPSPLKLIFVRVRAFAALRSTVWQLYCCWEATLAACSNLLNCWTGSLVVFLRSPSWGVNCAKVKFFARFFRTCQLHKVSF